MATNLMFTTDVVNKRKHKQAVCANFIHSLDAYHMRQIIRRVTLEGISVLPIHDSIVFDMYHTRIVKRIVAEEFNRMYFYIEIISRHYSGPESNNELA